MTISKSPQRNTFQKESYLERMAEKGKTPDNDPDVQAMTEFYDSWDIEEDRREQDPAWAENNMEYDLRTTDWILDKVRSSEAYAQNLYAAMCNNEFQKNDFLPRLKDQKWSCSWRYAGGIIAHMRQSGDYIDWYCSGIRGDGYMDDPAMAEPNQFVSESVVTEEIEADLKKLGWYVIKDNHDPVV